VPDHTTPYPMVDCTCLPVLTTGQRRDEGHHETWCPTRRAVGSRMVEPEPGYAVEALADAIGQEYAYDVGWKFVREAAVRIENELRARGYRIMKMADRG